MQSPAPRPDNHSAPSRSQTNRRIDDVRPQTAAKPEVHQIDVAESIDVKTKYSPLSAYMVNSKYIDPNANLAPKRPLGAKPQPARTPQAAFYDRAPGMTLDGAGLTDRIRRSGRSVPMVVAPMGASMVDRRGDNPSMFSKASAAIAAFFLLMREKLVFARDFIARKVQHFRMTHPRIQYSALHGAMVKKFGMRDVWFKLAVPVFLLAGILALSIFNGIMAPGERPFNPSGSDNSGVSQGSSDGQDNPAIPVNPSDGASSNGSTQNGSGGSQVQGSVGSQLQPGGGAPASGSGGVLPVGGMGGGSGTIAPTGGTPTTPQTNPTTPIVPNVAPPPTSPPVQVTSPPSTDCPCQTVNGVVQGATQTLQNTTQDTTEAVDALVPKM